MLVLARGGAFAHLWGFWMNRPAPPCGNCSFSEKKQKTRNKTKTNARGKVGWARLELPEPLLTKQKVKMVGYWPSSSVRFMGRVEANRQPS